jgi:hypothetical protein
MSLEPTQVLAEASEAVAGAALPTANKLFGIDEIGREAEIYLDYIAWRQSVRCEGYLSRHNNHEQRTGTEVLPYTL